MRQTNFQAIGTKWDIQVTDEVSQDEWAILLAQLHDRIEIFDKDYSRFRADSLVTKIATDAGIYDLPNDGLALLNFYKQLYDATKGNVTPLIGQTMVEAGYDADYSFKQQLLHRPPHWEDVMSYNQDSITVTQPVVLDFGAAGKGYLVDIVGEIIETAGIKTYSINAGGDIRHRSKIGEVLDVGLENPKDLSEAIGIAQLANQSLCASAGSKRAWEDFHHIINPETLDSPTDVLATWVMAADTMTADGLATALFFTDAPTLLSQFSFSYAVLYEDMNLERSAHFPVTVFEVS